MKCEYVNPYIQRYVEGMLAGESLTVHGPDFRKEYMPPSDTDDSAIVEFLVRQLGKGFLYDIIPLTHVDAYTIKKLERRIAA